MDDAQFDAFVARAVEELREKQETLRVQYGPGEFTRWWFDQEKSTIQFFDGMDRLGLEADFIDIGSFSRRSSTWKWAWCNDSVLPDLRNRATGLKPLGTITGMDIFTREEPSKVDEDMAWELAAMSVLHLSAVGCYRAPSSGGDLLMFLALMKIHRVN